VKVRAAVVLGACLALAATARSQIVLDGSLGSAGALLPDAARDVEIPERVGRRAGSNLFHSFSSFGIPEQTSATFTSDGPGISHVFARVTGSEASRIDGALRSTIDGADLYLLNPNGVLFGRGASVDLPGSLSVSGGESLGFSDGVRLWADPARPVTLSAEPPSAWGFGERSGPIAVDGSALSMRGGTVLSLAGGSIELRGRPEAGLEFGFAVVRVPQATLELVAVDSEGDALLGADGIDTSALARLGTVRILDSAQLDGTGDGTSRLRVRGDSVEIEGAYGFFDNAGSSAASDHAGRAIDIEARRRVVLRDSALTSEALGAARSGDVHLDAPEILLDLDSFVVAASSASGAGGDVDVRADRLEIRGSSELTSKAFSSGDAGDLDADLGTLRISGADSLLGSWTQGSSARPASGNGGDVSVRARSIQLDGGGQILVHTTASGGDAGRLHVQSDEIEIVGAERVPSGILSSEEDGATGRGGDVAIEARELRVLEGGRISARSRIRGANLRSGPPPRLLIEAERVEISGFAVLGTGDPGLSLVELRGIDRDAGELVLRAWELVIEKGALISASTEGEGSAGDVDVRAERVRLRGTDGAPGNPNESGIYSQALAGSSGAAGTVRLAARDLEVGDGARISVSTEGSGSGGTISINDPGREQGQEPWSEQARVVLRGGSIRSSVFPSSPGATGGDVEIHARELVLSGARIDAENVSAQGDAGSIRIELSGGLQAEDSEIKTRARGGVGGNIAILARTRVMLVGSAIATNANSGGTSGGNILIDPELVVLNRSSMQARAVQEDGGNIRIVAGHFVSSADSAVDASSDLGIDGTVVIDSPVEVIADEVVDLPDRVLDASDQLRRGCAARNTRAGSLTVSERVVRVGAAGVVGVEGEEGRCERP